MVVIWSVNGNKNVFNRLKSVHGKKTEITPKNSYLNFFGLKYDPFYLYDSKDFVHARFYAYVLLTSEN